MCILHFDFVYKICISLLKNKPYFFEKQGLKIKKKVSDQKDKFKMAEFMVSKTEASSFQMKIWNGICTHTYF